MLRSVYFSVLSACNGREIFHKIDIWQNDPPSQSEEKETSRE